MCARRPARARKEAAAVAAGLTIGLGLAATISSGIVPVPWADRPAPAEAAEERVGEPRHPLEADGQEPASRAVPEPSTPASAETGPVEEPVPARPGTSEPETTGHAPVPSPAQPPSATSAPQGPAPTSGAETSAPPQDAGAGTAQPEAPGAQGVGDRTPTAGPSPTDTRTATGAQGFEGDGGPNQEDRPSLPLFWWLAG